MTTTSFAHDPRPLADHPQRPWRRVESQPRRPSRIAEHRFATPLVRELPPRRELRSTAGAW
jgi:hypothetical protein